MIIYYDASTRVRYISTRRININSVPSILNSDVPLEFSYLLLIEAIISACTDFSFCCSERAGITNVRGANQH